MGRKLKIAGGLFAIVVVITLIVITIYFSSNSESVTCPAGKELQNGSCVLSPCPDGKELQNGSCVLKCPDDKVLSGGVCVSPPSQCPEGKVMVNGNCETPYNPTNPTLDPVCTPPCENGGKCTNSGCECVKGYLGVNCAEADINHFCPNSKCNTIVNPDTCECICPEGVVGKNCTIIDATYNECISGNKYPGLSGVWDGYKCLWTRQECPIQSSTAPVCTNYSSFWYAHDPSSSDPYQCFIGDEYDGKTIGDSGSYYSGDRCMTGIGQSGCEEVLDKINC